MEKPVSIRIPNVAVPKAVAKTIKAVVRAFIDPIYFTPYISAHVDDPRTLQSPLVTPIIQKTQKMKKDCQNKIIPLLQKIKECSYKLIFFY